MLKKRFNFINQNSFFENNLLNSNEHNIVLNQKLNIMLNQFNFFYHKKSFYNFKKPIYFKKKLYLNFITKNTIFFNKNNINIINV